MIAGVSGTLRIIYRTSMSFPFSNGQLWLTIAATGFCMGYFVLPWLGSLILRDYVEMEEEGFSPGPSSHSSDPVLLPLKSRLLSGLIGGLMSCLAFWKLGNSHEAPVFCAFFYSLVVLCFINLKVLMLPDSLVLPLLWRGIIVTRFSCARLSPSWGLALRTVLLGSYANSAEVAQVGSLLGKET